MAERNMRDMRKFWEESNTQIAVVRFLREALPSYYRVLSFPNGRFEANARTIARLKREGLTPGAPDLIILRSDGWFGTIEVKASDGKPTIEQVEFGDWIIRGGGSHAVVRSLSEVENVVRGWGVPLRAKVAA